MNTSAGINALIRVVVLLTAMVIMFFVVFSTGAEADTEPQQTALHVVQPGDTLWSLASRYTPTGGDVWATVEDIKDANEISGSMLHAGDQLNVPVGG